MKNNLSKSFYIFLFMGFSLHIFVLDLRIFDSNYFGVTNPIYTFYMNLWVSMGSFDVSWIILGIFLFDFYYNIYFIEGTWKYNKLIAIILSVIISLSILLGKSYSIYEDFRMIYKSPVQVYKCLMVGIGYYFLVYAIIKKFLFKQQINDGDII